MEQSPAGLGHSQAPGFCRFFLRGALQPPLPIPAGGTKKGAGQLLHNMLFMIVLNSFKSKLHLLF